MSEAIDLYSDILSHNLIAMCRPLLDKGYYLDTDGRLKGNSRVATDMPWIFAAQDDHRKCNLWHGIFFNVFGWLPSECTKCWKVVVRPKTLEQLFELHEFQKELGWASKSGIEVRNTVYGLYGGYFYTDSLEQGYKTWEIVSLEVRDRLGPDVPVLLKRGCTEMEHKFGDSSKWDELITDRQLMLEKKLDSFIDSNERIEQPDIVKKAIYKKWIEWAYQSGDETYLNFTGGQPLYPGYVTYND